MGKKPLEENGVHRARLWEIGFYALNNTSTNAYAMLMISISYFLVGIVGLGTVLAGSIVTIMRIWDGVTDPFVGFAVDRTNTKFGKNRPFIMLGQIILFATTWMMFNITPKLSTSIRFPIFIVLYAVYILGYTCQCVVTKSAQSCLTNDPGQRPLFSCFDSVYNILLMSMWWPIFQSDTLVPKYTINSVDHAEKLAQMMAQNPGLEKVVSEADGVTTLSAFYNPEMWQFLQLFIGAMAAIFAVLAIIGLSRKDNAKYFGTGKAVKVKLRDYADVLAHNRGIQMLVVSAGTDKLATSVMTNTTTLIVLFGVIMGNYSLNASNSALSALPICLFSVLGIGSIATKLGQKRCLIYGTYGAMVCSALIFCLCVFGDPMTAKMPSFSLTKPETYGNLFVGANWSFFGAAFLILYTCTKAFANLSGSIVIPMTADCADYETYRTGKYVPGLMGTLFSFVDKLISSLAATIVSLSFATIGFKDALPTIETPYTDTILWITMFLYVGMPQLGWIANLIAMKFYPLTKEKMAEIQDEIGRIKAAAMKGE